MLKNTQQSYGKLTKIFHWLIGLAIIGLIAVGFYMSSMEPSEEKWQLYFMHKSTGVFVLLLVVFRYVWRLTNSKVLLSEKLSSWQKIAAKITHSLLYLCMFLMPISGVMMSRFGGYDINIFNLFIVPAAEKNLQLASFFHEAHSLTAWGFAALIILHICAAFYHHFIIKDNTLIKMLKLSK